jgi:Lipocalin-like domain
MEGTSNDEHERAIVAGDGSLDRLTSAGTDQVLVLAVVPSRSEIRRYSVVPHLNGGHMSVYRWKSLIFAVVLAPLACASGSEAPEVAGETSAAPIEGASLYLFTGRHYSVTYANLAERARFAVDSAPTDAEKLQAYNTIVANSGTFELVGDTLTTHPVIARNPNFMGGGQDKFVMRTAGDTLWLTSVPGGFRWSNGKPTTPSNDSFTLVRER